MSDKQTQRTPQQSSRDAKEAREAWERGEMPEWSPDQIKWAPYLEANVILPQFSNPNLFWRVAKPAPPVITPGKWRTRGGLEVTIIPGGGGSWAKQGDETNVRWYWNGEYLRGEQHSMDLISRVETKWRAWKPEEVPSGWLRNKFHRDMRRLIVSVAHNSFIAGVHELNFAEALERWELLLPDGTYAPCGVEEALG